MNTNYNEAWKELREKTEKGVGILNNLNETQNNNKELNRIKGKIEGLNLTLSYMIDFEKIFTNESNDSNEIQKQIKQLKNEGNNIELNSDEIQILANLMEIFSTYKNDGRVKVINGMFKGFLGTIVDIDELDAERPLIIQLDNNDEFEGAIAYLNYDDVELLKNNKEQ